MTTAEIALRLGLAAIVGVGLGLNRDLHNKPTGVRTLGLVGLASALAVLAVSAGTTGDTSRVIQGIVTGIGFLGAGVIIRGGSKRVHNLTTAASVWLTAAAGAACGTGELRLVIIAALIALLILLFGGTFEKWVRRFWPDPEDDNRTETPP
jgi:putative Mg2+ transporter-C (MgtC) family protein